VKAHQKIAKVIVNSWQNKDYSLLRENLADSLSWYENPFDTPLKTADAVLERWQRDLVAQSNIEVDVEILATDAGQGIYRFRASWTEGEETQELDGIFLVRLNTEGKVKYFCQWWTAKDRAGNT